MTAPRVSVLMPAWNAERTVERAIASVLDDPALDVQVIVVDDASSDGTVGVVEALAARDPRVELVRAPRNGGPSAARNIGLPHVRGDWLTFLDADDRMFPGGLGALVRAAVDTDALASIGQRVWSDGERSWITQAYDQPDIREPGRKSILGNPGLLFYASGTGKLFHRSIIEGLRFEGRVLGDQPWTIRALLRAGDRIQVIADDVYEWDRPAPGSTDSSITSRKHDSAALAAEAVLVAIGAAATIRAEAASQLRAPADVDRVAAAYVERLVRSDFGGPVKRAIESRDPGTARLFEALTRFVEATPSADVAGAPSLKRLVRPPLLGWATMTDPAREAFVAFVRSLPEEAFPGAVGRGDTSARLRRAVRWSRRVPGAVAPRAMALLLRGHVHSHAGEQAHDPHDAKDAHDAHDAHDEETRPSGPAAPGSPGTARG